MIESGPLIPENIDAMLALTGLEPDGNASMQNEPSLGSSREP